LLFLVERNENSVKMITIKLLVRKENKHVS
jgi:hypothetical protein